MIKKKIKVKGMTCNSCTRLIESALKPLVKSVNANYSKDLVEVEYEEKQTSLDEIYEAIRKEGYEVEKEEKKKSWDDKLALYFLLATLGVLAYFLYGWISSLGIQMPQVGQNTSLALIFLVGILTGFHCVSMCGGFIIAYMTKNSKNGHAGFSQHLVYGGAKTASYIILGGLFGLLGSIISFSVGLRGGVAIFAGLFMVSYALSMMGFKFFRKFQFNPKFLSRFTAKASIHAKGPYKAPLITGLLSGLFIACGPLQAMYLYAAGTGSMVSGATSLAAFGLGTLPILLGFAGITTKITHKTMRKFLKISAIVVLILGLIMLNRGLTVVGSNYSFKSITGAVIGQDSQGSYLEGDYQVIQMKVDASGWTPDTFTLKKGVPVKWEIDVEELTSCNNEIIVNEYDLRIKLNKGLNVVEFLPDKEKTVQWSCWMGMIPGTFIVTESGIATQEQINYVAATTKPAGSCSMGSSRGCGCGGY